MPVNPVIPDPDALYCATCERTYPRTSGERCPKDGGRLVRIHRPDPLVGRELDGRYTIVDRLGQGGMGAIYRAVQRSFGRDVAIKVMNAQAGTNPELIKRFLREAKLASQLSHPNVVTVLDCGETDDGIFYIAMELVAGRTLSAILHEDRRLTPERIVRIGTQICEALDSAHAMSIVHRDLKPTNVMVLTRGRDLVKVLDFGLAKSLSPEIARTMTGLGEMIGTPAFMPPELANGQPCDSRADLYSLGCILYLCGTGELPFKSESVNELIAMHGVDKAPPMTGVPVGLARLVDRLLSKSPDDRYQTALETREALEACLDNKVSAASLASADMARGTGANGALVEATDAVMTTAIVPAPRGSGRLVVGLGLAIAGLLGVGAALAVDGAPDEALPAGAVALALGATIAVTGRRRGRETKRDDRADTAPAELPPAPPKPLPIVTTPPAPSVTAGAVTAQSAAAAAQSGTIPPDDASETAPTPAPLAKRPVRERSSAEIAVIVNVPLSVPDEDARSVKHVKLPLHVLDDAATPIPKTRPAAPKLPAQVQQPAAKSASKSGSHAPISATAPTAVAPPPVTAPLSASASSPSITSSASKPAPPPAPAPPPPAPEPPRHGTSSEELSVTAVVVVPDANTGTVTTQLEDQRSQRATKPPLKTTIGPAITPRPPSSRASQPQIPALSAKPEPAKPEPAKAEPPKPVPAPTPEPSKHDDDEDAGVNTAVHDVSGRVAAAAAAAARTSDSNPPESDDIPGEPTLVTPMELTDTGITQPPPTISRAKTPAPAPAPVVQKPLPPGARRLGSYIVKDAIAKSEDGPIYASRDDRDREVHVAALPDDLDLVAFAAMIKSLAKIDHANLVRVHELVLHAGKPYLVREPVTGRSLDEVLRERGPMPWADAVALLDGVCAALEVLHERGIVHGALRPACIAVDGSGKTCKLGGVGVMPGLSHRDGLAPEGGTSRRRDVFGIGAVLYCCVTGRTPQAGAAVPDTFPGKMFALATAMLAENPAERPPSIQDIRARLRA